MNPSTALARVLVDEMVRGGVLEAVLSPGSRSAPPAFALHDAAAAGRLRLHVRIDERTAGFLALGLAKASGRPVPVLTTSGTAAANLHPAVIEASYSGLPLVVLTADRPPELRDTGANQAIDQIKLYGDAVRLFHEVGAAGERVGQNAYWRSLVCRALVAATGALGREPGPVHLNLAFRDPLTPPASPPPFPLPSPGDWLESIEGRAGGAPWTSVGATGPRSGAVPPPAVDDLPERTLVIVGDVAPSVARQALLLAETRGWPVLSEPSGNARSGPNAITTADLLLVEPIPVDLRPDRILVVGRPTLTRAVRGLLERSNVDLVAPRQGWVDPARSARRVLAGVPAVTDRVRETAWLGGWVRAEAAARSVVDGVLDAVGGLTEQRAARDLVDAMPPGSLLLAGSSLPSRHLFLARGREEITVLANRGAAGIDGTVSSAIGAALAWQSAGGGPAYALLGDITFLHDATGLVLGPGEARPDLTLVVLNNDGGGIFSLLEQAGADHADAFEHVFGTPHGVDLAALCAATHTPHARVVRSSDLHAALAAGGPPVGIRVVEVRTERQATSAVDRRLREAVAAQAGFGGVARRSGQ